MQPRRVLSSVLLGILVIVSSLYLVLRFSNLISEPPVLHKPIPDPHTVAPGIGFDLTALYGTVAISYANGTTLPIAKVDGSPKYRETWKRLSLESSKHIAPPYDDMGQLWDDLPRQKWRQLLKKLGLPASSDVATIAEMLSALCAKAEAFTGTSVISAVATIPHFVAVYNEDIIDAFEYIGVVMLRQWLFEHLVYESTTAYAGSGFGFCRNYTDPVRCRNETYEHTSEYIMVLTYTEDALLVTLPATKGVFYLWEPMYRTRQSWDLGSNELLRRSTKDDISEYWALVRELIFNIFIVQHSSIPSKIFLTGESARDPEFKENVKEAIAFVSDGKPVPPIFDSDPLFVVARGAAEFAKRAPWTDKWWEIGHNRSAYFTQGSEEAPPQQILDLHHE